MQYDGATVANALFTVMTVMKLSLRQNLLVSQWSQTFVIFLFTDVDFMRYSSSIKYEIDVIK